MKFVTYRYQEKEAVGVVRGEDRVVPINEFGLSYEDMNRLICGLTADEKSKMERELATAKSIAMTDVQILAPILQPLQDVICLGLNYTEHAKEAGAFSDVFTGGKEKAIYFSKRVSVAAGDGASVSCYKELSDSCDYESELGVIIGKDARSLSAEDVKDHIFGYTIINDMTLRNLQTGHKQWYFAKSPDGYTPMGPCIVTADEIAYPPALAIGSTVNGEVRQNGNTADMIHSIDEIVCELSSAMTLKAGTVIATGTPKGVAMGMEKPEFLKAGDVVTCTIEKVGSLTVTMV
ncbi:MAG: fumarylacetoacetate hydrolase family protein [Firmicutes bacterium]|nr:fumarylacetoacetate hydrolase family protein [Bacillota bacterium]